MTPSCVRCECGMEYIGTRAQAVEDGWIEERCPWCWEACAFRVDGVHCKHWFLGADCCACEGTGGQWCDRTIYEVIKPDEVL